MEVLKALLQTLQDQRTIAEVKRLSYISILRDLGYRAEAKIIEKQTWKDYVCPVYHGLVDTAKKNGVEWNENEKFVIDEEVDLSRRGSLTRAIRGALMDAIKNHGPITKNNFTSAAKRIEGAILTYNHFLKQ